MSKICIVGTLPIGLSITVGEQTIYSDKVEVTAQCGVDVMLSRSKVEADQYHHIGALAAATKLIATDGTKYPLSYADIAEAPDMVLLELESIQAELNAKVIAESSKS